MEKPQPIRSKTKIIFTVFCIVMAIITGYHLYYAKKIIPGVEISGVDVGGMTFNEAKEALKQKETSNNKPLVLTYQGKNYEFQISELQLSYNIDSTVARAFEVGRTQNVYVDTKDKIAGIVKPLTLKSTYDVNEDSLTSVFSFIEGELNKLPQNASYKLEGENIVVVPGESGMRVDNQLLHSEVIQGFDFMDFSTKEIVTDVVVPSVTTEKLYQQLPTVSKLVNTPIKVVYEDSEWNLSKEELLKILTVTTNEDDGGLVLDMNDQEFETLASDFISNINKLPRGVVESDEEGNVTSFTFTQDGKKVNIGGLLDSFKKEFFANRPDAQKVVEVPVDVVSGEGDYKEYGIVSLLGAGSSKYVGSAQSRIHNLTLAAERTSGVLVAPGDVYSFNDSVGNISGSTGYATAYIISNGRTVLGDGGGVCQTSTTLFRAVLDAGLPVVSRAPHAYRVTYYEQESPVGIDASIYQPYLDFKFRNDTNNYILVQAYPNVDDRSLEFKIYGTPDGREVTISEPIVTGQTPPPEPLYQDDPNLAKGVVKQVDFAAWGATASFDRVVTKNGQVLHNDNFTTRYQPWRAVYLVGTRE